MHWQHSRLLAALRGAGLDGIPISKIQSLFPAATALGEAEGHGGRTVLAGDVPLGYVLQTFPEAEKYLGFSGPTNTLIGFDPRGQIIGLSILSSQDTRDHVELIRNNPGFLRVLDGKDAFEATSTRVDAVTGATLTSLAILQGVQSRLGKQPGSLKFPDAYSLEDARHFFPEASTIQRDVQVPELWLVAGEKGTPLGWLLSNSPAADEVVGYQGPTRAQLGMTMDGKILGLVVGQSFDNEPYVGYVRGDEWFSTIFNEKTLSEWGHTSREEAGIEGVSGATMTSQAVAEGLLKAARQVTQFRERQTSEVHEQSRSRWKVFTTGILIGLGLLLGLTRWGHVPVLRRSYQILLIAVMGFLNGDLLSMAMFVGWAKSGLPWKNAVGLLLLAAAALVLPIVFKRNVYCDHLCPHGALQQLLPREWKLKHRPRWLIRSLRAIRPILLVLVVLIPILGWNISLVDLEPFDAYAWRAAGIATISIAILGLMASLFIPMGYCHYGCPTGAVLGYLRRHARSDRLTRNDAFAVALLATATICCII